MMEQVHSETYSLLIETYVRDTEEKDYLFNGMENSTSPSQLAETWSTPINVNADIISSRHQEEGRVGFKVHHA